MDGGGAAAATLQVLVQSLIDVSKEEISLVRGLEKNADKLKETLGMIQGYLNDAEKKIISEEAVRSWLQKLEAVAFDADIVLDELNYDILAKKMKSIIKADKKAEKKKAPSCFPSFNHYSHRRQMALRIKEVNTSFESITKMATGLSLEKIFLDAPAAPDNDVRETDSFALDPIFIGRDNDVKEIVELLTRSPVEQVFSILPIVGMGGLGKTTVARNVYYDQKIRAHFGKHIWVHVSKNFDPVILFKKILEDISGSVEEGSRQLLLKKLQETLKDKTYLLVLDDNWNEDKTEWEDFINSLSGISFTKGNCIIVTTRSTEVASIVKTLDIHPLEGLSGNECWSIIKGKAFKGGDIPSAEFETIGRKIAERCQGLPLAASIVGGVLQGKSEDDWLSIQENWLSSADGHEDNISKILKLSYDNLSSPSLKKCFAYCSIFPKGYEIDREELIELWMAEGFLQPDQHNDMEATGNKFFNLLLQNSLLLVAIRKFGIVTHSMHDLVHDLAWSLLNSKANENSNGIIRYIRHEDDESPIRKEQAEWSRALFFKGEISGSSFVDFKCLHALILISDFVELPSSIGKLIHLRFLSIRSNRIEHLPDSIGELYHLQTFRFCVRRHFALVRSFPLALPSTFKYLISLRHLHIGDDIKLPDEVGRLTSLQTLREFEVGTQKGHQIAELGGLNQLKGSLKIYNLQNVHDEEEAKSAHLFRKPNIVTLVLRWNTFIEGERNDEKVLDGLQPHPNLRRLEIYGFQGSRFPLWILRMAVQDEVEGHWARLNNLTKITLEECGECGEIPTLGHLPHLKSLLMKSLPNVRSIGSSFYGIDNFNSNNEVCKGTIVLFPALTSLRLLHMGNLTQWVEVEISNAMETQPREVKVFPCLELLDILSCKKLVNICGSKITSLTELNIETIHGLESLPDWLFCSNKNLTKLKIKECPNLRELPDGLHTLNSLEELSITECGNLKSMTGSSCGQSQGLTSLRSLSIIGCKRLINLPCEMIEPSVPSLESVSLYALESLTNYHMVIDFLQKMPRLTKLGIGVNVSQFISSTRTETANFCSLQELRISYSSAGDCDSLNEIVSWILRGSLKSLQTLKLVGKKHWDSLPDQLQHLKALSSLELRNFGIETLPEWLGKLSSLTTLELLGCEKLRQMPSQEVIRRLTKLQRLYINYCPLLKERCKLKQQNDDESEWPKISHIPEVYVNGRTFYHGKGGYDRYEAF